MTDQTCPTCGERLKHLWSCPRFDPPVTPSPDASADEPLRQAAREWYGLYYKDEDVPTPMQRHFFDAALAHARRNKQTDEAITNMAEAIGRKLRSNQYEQCGCGPDACPDMDSRVVVNLIADVLRGKKWA